ncbi:hypothetical protein CR513_59759, partial [Mucuna pruriens]
MVGLPVLETLLILGTRYGNIKGLQLGKLFVDMLLRHYTGQRICSNSIPMLNRTNFKLWKEAVEIMLRCIDLDLAHWIKEPIPTLDNLHEVKIEKWECSNQIALFQKRFETLFLKVKGRGNIREYIIKMSNLATKLKSLKLGLSEDLIVHLVLILLPIHIGQFKVSYNTRKDKWSLNEFISHYVQKEERL